MTEKPEETPMNDDAPLTDEELDNAVNVFGSLSDEQLHRLCPELWEHLHTVTIDGVVFKIP